MRQTTLSTAEVANLFSVTETTVKRWADEGRLLCQKTPGGHRKFGMKDVIQFAEEFGFSPTGILSFSETDEVSRKLELAVLRRDFNLMAQSFVEKALTPQQTDLYEFLSYLYQHHISLTDIYDSVIRPGMKQIGELWQEGKISVAHEHQAAAETINAIIRLQSELRVRKTTTLSALCACPEDEQHDIGLRCIASVLRVEGWTVHYLGSRTPMEAIGELCKELQPSLVCLSTMMEVNAKAMIDELGKLRRILHARKAKLVFGGGAMQEDGSPWIAEDKVIQTSAGLLEYVHREFQAIRGKQVSMRGS